MSLRTTIVAAAVALASVAANPAFGQQAPAPPRLPDAAAVTAPQIQRWFEAYTALQAQEALALSESQYGPFVTRLKSLQETRRRQQQARNKVLAAMRRLTNPQTGTQDEAQLAELLIALREADDRAAVELKKAYEALDETLDIRQQARFRVFEERAEQQKLELLMRARQNARAGRGRNGGR
jgi:hypothetical protein